MSSYGWVVASPPRQRGPQVRVSWHHGCHGAVDVVGPVAPPGRASRGRKSVHRLAKMGSRRRFGALVYTVALLRTPWVCRSVHRSAKTASRRWFGAFVYTVATRFAKAATHTKPPKSLITF